MSKLYFPSRPGKTADPHFCQYHFDTNNDKFSCCNNLYRLLKAVIMRLKPNSYWMQPKMNNSKFTCSFENPSQMAETISASKD